MNRFLITCTLILFSACYLYRYQEPANINTLNQQIMESKYLEFIMNNGDTYQISVESMSEDSISGVGSKKIKDKNTEEGFKGTLPLDSIDLIIISDGHFGKSMLINASVIMLSFHCVKSMEGPESPELEPAHRRGSCPFIYSWDGEKYLLEAEAFGTALGKALETETSSVLRGLHDNNGVLRLRITNERPETHYINAVKLSAVKHDSAAKTVLSNKDIPWPVFQSISPVRAKDHSKRDITTLLTCEDGQYWQSDLSQVTVNSTLRDQINLSFLRPRQYTQGSLLFRVINTDLITSVYHSVFGFLGDETLPFLQQLEREGPTVKLLREWTEKSGLHVEIKNHDMWYPAGVVMPEANFVPFTRLVRLNFSDIQEDTVHIRLSALPDVWKIDAVAMDWTPVTPLDMQPIITNSAQTQYGTDVYPTISSIDQKYAILIPGEHIEFTFEKTTSLANSTVSYIIHTRGYLHEWLNKQTESSPLSLIADMTGGTKIDFLNYLLQHERLLLPPIYADWKMRR